VQDDIALVLGDASGQRPAEILRSSSTWSRGGTGEDDAMSATRTIVMSGATGGIGIVAGKRLLREAPDIHLVVLARTDADAAAEEVRHVSGSSNVTGVVADLACLDSIREAASTLRSHFDRHELPQLSGFVGNAGLQMLNASTETVDHLEATFAVNVLANYVLIDELADQFAPGARVVLTASDTHFGDFAHNLGMVPGPRWKDPRILATASTEPKADNARAGRTAYATSKLAVIYLVHELARRRPDLEVFSFNPGLVPGTGLAREAGPVARFAFRFLMPALALTPWLEAGASRARTWRMPCSARPQGLRAPTSTDPGPNRPRRNRTTSDARKSSGRL
jgi:NAD(P)-dependent dehydrogenase (short-subunit alcohol dehydrogenase family)